MKIGFVVDGLSEVAGLPRLFDRILTPHQLLKPIPEKLQPYATPEQTALLAARRCRILVARQS